MNTLEYVQKYFCFTFENQSERKDVSYKGREKTEGGVDTVDEEVEYRVGLGRKGRRRVVLEGNVNINPVRPDLPDQLVEALEVHLVPGAAPQCDGVIRQFQVTQDSPAGPAGQGGALSLVGSGEILCSHWSDPRL